MSGMSTLANVGGVQSIDYTLLLPVLFTAVAIPFAGHLTLADAPPLMAAAKGGRS